MISKKTFELLEELDQIPEGKGSRTAKMVILKLNKSHLRDYFDIALNPYRVYNIQQIPEAFEHTKGKVPSSLEELAKYLETQRGSTTAMKHLVAEYLYGQPVTHDKWIRAALLKDVKLGIEIKSLNKCGYNLPTFELLLASPNKHNSLEGIKYNAVLEPKLDGCRAIYLPDKKVFLGRNGREVENEQIYKHFSVNSNRYVLDGEFYSFKRKFNEIVGYFTADNRELPDDIKFVVFNAIPVEDWYQQKTEFTYLSQLNAISAIVSFSKNISLIPHKIVSSETEVTEGYQQYLSEGFEGAMIRNAHSTYAWERVKVKDGVLTKLKPFDYADCVIVDAYEGKGRNIGRLGGFIVDYEGNRVDVGGGYSDSLREEFWKNKNQMIGKSCGVKYSEITEDKSLRFPVWDSMRDAK